MTVINVIYTSRLSFQEGELRRFLTQAGLSIQHIHSTGDLYESFQQLNDDQLSIFLCETERGITQEQVAQFLPFLQHRFQGAENILTQGTPFKQVLVGAKGRGIVMVLPVDQTIFRSLATLTQYHTQAPIVTDFEPEEERQTFVDRITVLETPKAELPPSVPESIGSGWMAGLKAIGGKIESEIWATIPESISQIAPARNVLETAGERRAVRLHSGKIYVLFGYPDLRRASSKALLIGEAEPFVEVIALHRSPKRVGIVCSTGTEWLPSIDRSFDKLSLERTGREAPQSGTLFALDQNTIYYQLAGKVFSWNGSAEKEMGTVKQAIASLLLSWSQR